MAARNDTNAKRAAKLDNQRKALELRRMGLGYEEIGQRLNLRKSQAHRLVTAALAETAAMIAAEADTLKAEELSRLDAMFQGLWTSARKGNLSAIDRALKIMERRARMLGLDAPTRQAFGGDPDAPPIETRTSPQGLSDDELERIARGGST